MEKVIYRIYLERRLIAIGMSKMNEFENWSQQYWFQCMTTAMGKFSTTLVRELYTPIREI